MESFKSYLNAKTRTPEEIAKKHGVSVEDINKAVEIGIGVEKEHSKIKAIRREIALDHLWERPDYYTKLKKVEG